MNDLIVIDDLSVQEIQHIFSIADDMAGIIETGRPRLCHDSSP